MRAILSTRMLLASFAALAFWLPATIASAAAYAKFEGVDGESSDQHHRGWCEILSFSQRIQAADGSKGDSRRPRRASFEDIKIERRIDKASPKLEEAAAKGEVFPKVTLHLTSANGKRVYYVVELRNALITSYGFNGTGDSVPTEEVALSFKEIKVTYTEYDSTGKSKGNVEFSYKIGK